MNQNWAQAINTVSDEQYAQWRNDDKNQMTQVFMRVVVNLQKILNWTSGIITMVCSAGCSAAW